MRRSHNRLAAVLAAAAVLASGSAAAQQVTRPTPVPASTPRLGGTRNLVQYHIGAFEFAPADTTFQWAPAFLGDSRGIGVGTPFGGGFLAYPHLPTGALLQSLELDYCVKAGGSVNLHLDDCNYLGGDCQSLSDLTSGGLEGCFFVADDLASKSYTMQNGLRQLILSAEISGSGSASLLGAFVGYKLQVSPAPAAATFADVPTSHPFFRAIEAVAGAGITSGCGGGNFCPNQAVTRGELAKFLANGLGLNWPD